MLWDDREPELSLQGRSEDVTRHSGVTILAGKAVKGKTGEPIEEAREDMKVALWT